MPWSERLFERLPDLLPGVNPPGGLDRLLGSKRKRPGSEWMARHGLEERFVQKGAWNLLLITSVAALVSLAVGVIALGPTAVIYCLVPVALVPLIATSLYLNAPEGFAHAEARAMLREGPSIIGCMTMSMQVQPSLEQAVGFAAGRGTGVLADRLREVVWATVTRTKGSLSEAVVDLASSFAESNASLKHAFHLVISATCERSKEGMDRLLDKANQVALGGVREAVEAYAAALSMPTMVLFSLGTLLPIMLFSILPLLTLGGALGGGAPGLAVPYPYLVFLLLVLIPTAAVVYSWSVLSRNPLGLLADEDGGLRDLFSPASLLIWAVSTAGAAMLDLGAVKPYVLGGAIVLTPCAFLAWSLRGQRAVRRRKEAMEREAINALFQIGNRMVSGATFDKALHDVFSSQSAGPFSETARALLYRSRLSGKGFMDLIQEEGNLRAASPMIENAYVTVVLCADRDPRYAGRVALNLAQMLSDLRSCQGKIEEKLRGVVDMMRSTGTVFAPIVLGVTGALFALIGDQATAGGGLVGDMDLITGIYIGELSFLVSFFTVQVMGQRSWKSIAHSYAVRTPVAFVVFVTVSLICRTGLTALG